MVNWVDTKACPCAGIIVSSAAYRSYPAAPGDPRTGKLTFLFWRFTFSTGATGTTFRTAGRFTRISSDSALSLLKMENLFDCNDLIGTIERLLSTVRREKTSPMIPAFRWVLPPFQIGTSPSQPAPSRSGG